MRKSEDQYQRLVAFLEDNLLKQGGGITHHGYLLNEDEELTPSLENVIVLTWLKLLHPDLPKLIKQRYGTELRSRTLASIKPEISQALPSLLEEIHSLSDAKVLRSAASQLQTILQNHTANRSVRKDKIRPLQRSPLIKRCPLCKEAGRNDQHFLSVCKFLNKINVISLKLDRL